MCLIYIFAIWMRFHAVVFDIGQQNSGHCHCMAVHSELTVAIVCACMCQCVCAYDYATVDKHFEGVIVCAPMKSKKKTLSLCEYHLRQW